jgi:ABC-type Fe3+/spermidine/putrescine transport system ATPase subunit
MLLKVDNLFFDRSGVNVLKDISLEVPSAKITCVLGANGSGKSTLLGLLAGMLEPSSGTIYLEEKPVLGPEHTLVKGHRQIALVRQDARLTPFATVRENLKHVLRMHDEGYQEEKINELCEVLGLQNYLERTVKFLSGGEQQRVAIASALASNPLLLLMDEPFSQTDLFLKQELKHYLFDVVNKLGTSLLFVTHDPNEALSMADHILILHESRIIEQGNGRSLYSLPHQKATARLTGYCNFVSLNFDFFKGAHIIDNEYLIRSEQLFFTKEKVENSIEAVVQKTEFSGFYLGLHLYIPSLGITLFGTLPSNQEKYGNDEKGWLSFLKN